MNGCASLVGLIYYRGSDFFLMDGGRRLQDEDRTVCVCVLYISIRVSLYQIHLLYH